MKTNKTFTVTFPTLWIIPALSIIYSIIRVYDGVSWNFAITIVIAPILTYLGWCIGYFVCVCLSIFAMKIHKGDN